MVRKNNNKFKTASDLVYTVMSTVVMNVALQIIIYPLITRFYGEEITGNILYFIGIIYIIPQATGTALNSARLMMRKECEVTNRDFLPIMLAFSALSACACGFIGFRDSTNIIFSVFYGLFSVAYLLRIYLSVEFRLKLQFKGYFGYHALICAGYLAGFGLYLVTDVWLLIFLTGELAAIAYSLIAGTMLKNDGKTKNRSKINKTVVVVFISTIIRDCVNQFDKVVLKQLMNPTTVTYYHVVSLIAKTILMLVQPINSLILTYLTVKDKELSKKQLVKFTVAALGCGAVFYVICIAGTPLFIKLFYPDLYDEVIRYNLIVNLGLIIGFVSTMFMAILLTQNKSVLHMTIQSVWGIAYVITSYFFVQKYEMLGLAYVTLVANIIKLGVSILCIFIDKRGVEEPIANS